MCCNTKQKIADAVEELICTQPGGRVTVQQVMELTRMNRQSFYYHYQDINDVLRTIVSQKVCEPLSFDPEEDPESWCRRGLTLLKEQKPLLRRISRELGDDQVWALLFLEIRPQVDRLLPVRDGQDPVQREMAVDAFPEHGNIFADPLSFSVSSHVGPDAFGMAVSRRLARTKDGI